MPAEWSFLFIRSFRQHKKKKISIERSNRFSIRELHCCCCYIIVLYYIYYYIILYICYKRFFVLHSSLVWRLSRAHWYIANYTVLLMTHVIGSFMRHQCFLFNAPRCCCCCYSPALYVLNIIKSRMHGEKRDWNREEI